MHLKLPIDHLVLAVLSSKLLVLLRYFSKPRILITSQGKRVKSGMKPCTALLPPGSTAAPPNRPLSLLAQASRTFPLLFYSSLGGYHAGNFEHKRMSRATSPRLNSVRAVNWNKLTVTLLCLQIKLKLDEEQASFHRVMKQRG